MRFISYFGEAIAMQELSLLIEENFDSIEGYISIVSDIIVLKKSMK